MDPNDSPVHRPQIVVVGFVALAVVDAFVAGDAIRPRWLLIVNLKRIEGFTGCAIDEP